MSSEDQCFQKTEEQEAEEVTDNITNKKTEEVTDNITNKKTEKNDEHEFLKPAPPEKLMQMEEAKFKSKYGNLKPCGGSALLAKRLQKQKYFDSGDYNMAKAKMNNPKKPLPAQEKLILQETLGDAIPTPESLATRKPSLIQSKLVDGSLS